MTINVRVQKHREKLRRAQCRRLEVWIAGGMIDDVRQLAKAQKRSTWDVVEEALQAYVTGHTAPPVAGNSG